MFIFSDETVLQVSRISNIALMLFTSEHKACFCRKERKNISGVVEIQYKVNVYILIPQIVGFFVMYSSLLECLILAVLSVREKDYPATHLSMHWKNNCQMCIK